MSDKQPRELPQEQEKVDDAKRVEDLQRRVNLGDADAYYDLGRCYYYGIGVEKDKKYAVQLYTNAEKGGNVEAQNYLGLCYENGYGIEQDFVKAVQFYALAASRGNAH